MGKGPSVPQSAVDTNVALQKQEMDLLSKYSSLALPGLRSASDYWQNILAGGDRAQAAVAPYAQVISGQTQANQRNILSTLPAGGERNLATANAATAGTNNLAQLYAGLQPTAATSLANLALGTAGAGTGSGGVSASAARSNLNLAAQQAQAKGQMFGGIGSGLGTLAGGYFGGPAFASTK